MTRSLLLTRLTLRPRPSPTWPAARPLAALGAVAVLLCSGCSGGDETTGERDLLHTDASGEDGILFSGDASGLSGDGQTSTKDGASAPDTRATDTLAADTSTPDTGQPDTSAPDASAQVKNTAPQFMPPAKITLDQGASTTVDLAPLLWDSEDKKADLTITWSAKHVALKLQANQVLYVVAPTLWFGIEQIDLTVTDPGGLSAMATLQVTVNEVTIVKPKPKDTCGEVVFSVAAGKGQHEVLLSGSFNSWASTAKTADVLTDPTGSGVWTVTKKLPTGVHQYKYIVDGKWMADANNPNQTPDGYGGKNSVIEVPKCD